MGIAVFVLGHHPAAGALRRGFIRNIAVLCWSSSAAWWRPGMGKMHFDKVAQSTGRDIVTLRLRHAHLEHRDGADHTRVMVGGDDRIHQVRSSPCPRSLAARSAVVTSPTALRTGYFGTVIGGPFNTFPTPAFPRTWPGRCHRRAAGPLRTPASPLRCWVCCPRWRPWWSRCPPSRVSGGAGLRCSAQATGVRILANGFPRATVKQPVHRRHSIGAGISWWPCADPADVPHLLLESG